MNRKVKQAKKYQEYRRQGFSQEMSKYMAKGGMMEEQYNYPKTPYRCKQMGKTIDDNHI